MDTCEIRILVGKQWSTDSRCNDEQEAVRKANIIAGDRHIDGVKVVHEIYDDAEGLFREKTIFSYFKQDEKVFNPKLKKQEEVVPQPHVIKSVREKSAIDVRAWLMAGGLLVSIAGNLALAFFWDTDWIGDTKVTKMETRSRSSDKLVIYDLPAVTMNYDDNGESKAVRFRLGLELNSKDDIRKVRGRLTDIINSVANDLSNMKAEDLHGEGRLDKLRSELEQGIQSAAGSTPIEGVLFKEIIVSCANNRRATRSTRISWAART